MDNPFHIEFKTFDLALPRPVRVFGRATLATRMPCAMQNHRTAGWQRRFAAPVKSRTGRPTWRIDDRLANRAIALAEHLGLLMDPATDRLGIVP
jgi:hypothetical protein